MEGTLASVVGMASKETHSEGTFEGPNLDQSKRLLFSWLSKPGLDHSKLDSTVILGQLTFMIFLIFYPCILGDEAKVGPMPSEPSERGTTGVVSSAPASESTMDPTPVEV